MDTIFIPTDKKELRSKFLKKLSKGDEDYAKGSEVEGGRDGLFIEKPDIIDKYCRREIKDRNPELKELSPLQFGKMYDPISGRKSKKDDEELSNNIESDTNESIEIENDSSNQGTDDPWIDDDDRVANYFITTNPKYDYIPLPQYIKLKDPQDGEVPIFEKRSFPKAARIHKKRQDNDPHRFFLSELMLYTGYTDERQLGCDDETK